MKNNNSREGWFNDLQEVIQLLTKQKQFRVHLTEVLGIICRKLDADNALLIETSPNPEKEGQFLFHRILEVKAIGTSIEHNIPSQLQGKVFHNQRAKTWANDLIKTPYKNTKIAASKTAADKLKKNRISQTILKAVSIEFSSFLLFPLIQEEVVRGFLFFSSIESIRRSKGAYSFASSCVQILTNLLANQQLESLRIVKQDFLQSPELKKESNKENQARLPLSYVEEQAELASHIASTIPDYIFLVDIEKGKAVFANNEIFLGYDIAKKKDPLEIFATVIHPDDQAIAIMEFILKLKDAKDGEVVSSEYRMRHKDGHWVWISERAKVFKRFPNGVVKQYVAIMQDVTEKKKALLRMSESEQRYRNLIKYSTEGIFYMNCGKPIFINLSPEEQTDQYYKSAFIQECNLALAEMYDYTTEKQLEGQKVKDIHSRASYQLNRQSFQDFVENHYHVEDTQTVEMIDDGSIRYFVNRRLGIIKNNHLIGIWGVQRDITAKKLAESLEKESASLLKAILHTLPDIKLRINYQGKILAIYASSQHNEEEQLSIKNVEEKDLESIYPSFVAKGLLFNARKALDTQQLQTFEFIDTKEKNIQYFEARINSITLEEAIIILRNITPRKIAEKAFNDQIDKYDREKRQLEKYIESNLQLENFAYIASHDLREPLRTIHTFGQFLDKKIGNKLDKDSRSYLDFIINAANRMNQLIESLLAYSRVDTDPLTREAIDTEKLIQLIIDSLRTRIDETQTKIIIKGVPPVIYGSPVRIEQVFQNLIANAIKFHQNGKAPIIIISSKETPNYWQFSIEDNGIGIKEEFFDKIFAIFKKLHGHQVYHGTGIGLALVKRIISQQGGEVWLESKEGVGTTFYFTLLK